ncbi:MAG TPA: hypothetical protein VGU24_21320 [Microvirga sp.]|jgi:hypothetical protein|nr:hypothetical protein [Microvirga sp.]
MNMMQAVLTGSSHVIERETVEPTVGLCHWTRLASRSREVVFAPGEFVHLRTPVPRVVVQTIGGTLPPFAAPQAVLDEWPDAEVVILHEAPWVKGGEEVPERLQAFNPSSRAIVSDQAFDQPLSQEGTLPWADIWIDARAENLNVVAEALAALLVGEKLVCVGWTDLRAIGGVRKGQPTRGRAVVLDGVGDETLATSLHQELSRLAGEGFDGGWCLMQLVTPQDYALLTLEGLDQFAMRFRESDSERDLLLTAALNASRTAVVAVAFRPVPRRAQPSRTSRANKHPAA